MHIQQAQFVTSVADLSTLPSPTLPEFAFIGRSNVGKSTLINMLTQHKGLAKASSTPGKTQLLNIFEINNTFFFIDLPGYGYAKAKDAERGLWIDRTQEYLTTRKTLRQTFVLIDGSIPPQQIDRNFCISLYEDNISFAIIITKTDKASQREVDKNIILLKQQLQTDIGQIPSLFVSSSKKNRGRDQILDYIASLL